MSTPESPSDRHARQVRQLIAIARRPGASDAALAAALRAATTDDGSLTQAYGALVVLGEAVESHRMAIAAAQDTGYRIGLAEGREECGVSHVHPVSPLPSLPQ